MPIPAGPADLSASWIRQVLAEEGDSGGEGIHSIRAELIGVGYGLDGTVARVTTLGPGGEAGTLVAKWCRAEAGAHEARFYREIAPRLGIDLPHLRAAAVDADRALLLLEEVTPSRQGDAIVGATPAEAERIVEVIATFHARFGTIPEGPSRAWLPRWGRDPGAMAERTRARLPGFLDRWGSTLSPRVRALAERLPEALLRAYASLARAPTTLVHNDLHLDNVLFRPDGAPVVIDWTQVAVGPGAVDVMRFLIEGMTVDTRRALEGALVDRYLDVLTRAGLQYDPRGLRADLDHALTVLFAGAIRSKEPGTGPPVPRLVPVIENLVRNVTAAIEDRSQGGP